MRVGDGKHLLVGRRLLQAADERSRLPGDEIWGRFEHLLAGHRHDLGGEVFDMSLPVPGIGMDVSLVEQDVDRVLAAILRKKHTLQLLSLRRLERGAVGGHAATLSAWSMRLSMVQMPSTPGRHSGL